MNFEEENPLVEVAMQIIIHAGDSREKASQALKHAKEGNYEQAHACIGEAKELIIKAHHEQTDVVQSEAAGKHYDINLLFIHAQDTLMTIKSEVKLAAEMVEMYELFDKKIEALRKIEEDQHEQ